MANRKLGIDVEIKYPTANQIKDGINKEWQKVKGDFDIKVNVAPDGNSLKSLRKKIQNFLKNEQFEFALRMDSVQAIKDIREIRKDFRDLRREAENAIEFKFSGVKEASKSIKDIAQNTKQSTKEQVKSDTDKMSRLRDIMNLQKEMNNLQSKKVNAGASEQAVYNKRIEELAVHLQLAKNEYRDLFKSNADGEWMVSNVKKVGEFNVELREAQKTQKDTNELVKQYTGLLNEEFRIQKDLQVSGEKQGAVLKEQLTQVRLKRGELMDTHNIYEKMNDSQRKAVTELMQQNSYQLKLTQAKREDAEMAKRQNATYKELKTDMNEIYKMQLKVNELQAKADYGVITGKEEEVLNSLRQQLMVRQDMHNVSRDVAQAEGLLSKEAEEGLGALQKQHAEKAQIAKETANLNADLKITNNLYDELMNSVRRVKGLTNDLSSAGSREADVIRKTIRAEEDKQAEIRETLKAQERVNNAREDEYATMKRVNAEQEELSAERSKAKSVDTFTQNSAIGMLDPRTVYNEGKQVAMAIYDVVATLDEQIVNIEKVADASEEEMNAFKSNVFDFASDVGKTAEEYATSVERWVTAGFTLSEGMQMARESTMGAFVGNIDEADMVDYMSVPLISWKDTALEASDVLNIMNEVANNNAIEMDDLGEAYKRASNTASTAGTTFSELTGMITAAQEATRLGGDKIGTSLRTIDINFSKIASKLSKSDVEKFSFLKGIGVNLEDSEGNLRSTYNIMSDLSSVWSGLNSKEQSTASFYIAGKQHATTLQAIVGNWDLVSKATGEANEQLALVDKTSGSAYKEFEKQTESVEFAVAGLKNAWAEFIHEISGGRGGVTMVVNELKKLVEIATKLAKNDTFMAFAKTFLKATLWLTANVAIQKVFNTLSLGLFSTLDSVSKLGGIMKGLSGLGKFGKVATDITGIATATTGTTTALSATTGILGGLKFALGKVVPVIGLTMGALALLDIAGVDVVGMFKSLVSGTDRATKAVMDYQEVHKKTSQIIEQNALINQEFDEVNNLIDKYKDLNKQKEKTAKKDGKPTVYTSEEYTSVRDNFNAQAEALDIDLRIQFNDYEHIKNQLDALEEQKNVLEASSAKELAKNIQERNKLPTNQYTYEDEYNKGLKDLESRRNSAVAGQYTQEAEYLEKEIAEYSRVSKAFMDEVFGSKKFEEAKKAREKMIKDSETTRDELVKIHKTLLPEDLGEKNSFFTGQEMMPALAEMQSELNKLNGITKQIGDSGKLTDDQMKFLIGRYPEFSELKSETKSWSDTDREAVKNAINGQKELTAEMQSSVESRVRALLEYSGMVDGEEINQALERLKGSHVDVISVMASMGEAGRLAMGVSEEALAIFGDDWAKVMIAMQNDIAELPEDKVLKYNLVTDDGFFNWEVLELVAEIPQELITKYKIFDENGTLQLENIVDLIDEIPEEKLIELGVLDESGNVSIEKLAKKLEELPEEELIKIFVNATQAQEKQNAVMAKNQEIRDSDTTATIDANTNPFGQKMELATGELSGMDNKTGTPKLNADKTLFDGTANQVIARLNDTNNREAKPSIKADATGFWNINNSVDKELKKNKEKKITFKAVLSGAWDMISKTSGFLSLGKSKSVGITEPNIGGALAQGVSQSVGVSASTTSKSKGNPRYNNNEKPATVDGDVWRYWAKELFKGIPLENSMNNLNNSITNASEDNKKLISLYKEQNKLIGQQVAYEKDMKNAQQAEMNSILSQLRKQGFKTSGNQVTNLGITKNMKGDKAERSTELLNQWKKLYEAIDGTNDKIRSLNQEVINNNKSIKDAQQAIKDAQKEEEEKRKAEAIEKELKSIEKTLKRTEGLLKNIQNDMSIFSTKIGFISDSDLELKLTVTEEGINKSSQNVKKLTEEFNKLSIISVKYEDNVDTLQSELESLKSEILSNADSILEYKEALKSLEIQRMVDDFDKFGATVERNISKINNNIDNLKDGLLSGQSLADLSSSTLSGLDFSRKTKIEKDYEQRLQLERELNEALDGFAKKNIDRVKNVANSTLTIEQSKYSQLLKLANGFSNGKVENITATSSPSSIGATTADVSKNKEYQAWLTRLTSINNSYTKAYSSMVSKYDTAMKKAKTASEKDMITNAMIIDQLKLQESIYQSMQEANNQAIKNTQEMLKDSSLTTEQRQNLLDNIEEYRESNISSQNSIKDSIKARFDLEFDLIDEAIEKAEKYTNELSNMMSIAEALGSGDSVMNELYRALYQSKINEYSKATDIIKDLAKQQSKFAEGSYEWNILQEKILDTQDSLSDLTVDILNANKDILGSQLDIIQKANEKLTLGTSADTYDKYRNDWIDGVEKELELEKLRLKLAGLEDKTLRDKIELMDRQEKASRAELEYVNKQLEAVSLQEKLENIRGERNVKTLAKDSKGDWQWQYVADQSEYNSTKEELDSLRLEIEKYREEQRREYVNEMNDIIGRVKDGEFKDVMELEDTIASVNEMFDDILGDIKDMAFYDTASIIKAYQDYLGNNNTVISGINAGNGFTDKVAELSSTFEQTFLNITTDLSKLIADELKRALNTSPIKSNGNIVIENQVLEFPNVTDSSGLEEAFRELPQIAKQISTTK